MNMKRMIRESGVKQWQVAAAMGVSEATMVRWLRTELPKEKETAIKVAIDRIKGGMK